MTDDAEGRVGDRLPFADGAAARRLEPVSFPEHEPAPTAFRRKLCQAVSLGVDTFSKMFQMIFDILLGSSDGEGDLFRGMRAFFQEGADPTPYRFFFFDGGWRFSRRFSVHAGHYAIIRCAFDEIISPVEDRGVGRRSAPVQLLIGGEHEAVLLASREPGGGFSPERTGWGDFRKYRNVLIA